MAERLNQGGSKDGECGASLRYAYGFCPAVVVYWGAMAQLATGMSHADAARHLREEVSGTARRETGRLIDPALPGYFGAVRGVMCDVDYVAALYDGWDGINRRHIATGAKAARFLREMLTAASGNSGYDRFAEHIYQLYRIGTVHLRAPKIIKAASQQCSTEALTWALMYAEQGDCDVGGQTYCLRHLEPIEVAKRIGNFGRATMLPVSIRCLFDDFLSACECYASRLEKEERAGGVELLGRWRSAADVLVTPEPNDRLRW
jgi:hypothetical protein